MSVIEVQVHRVLVAIARQQGEGIWQHHLTLARLVARGLRLGRSALIQTHTGIGDYALSYLTPALMGDEPVAIVVPPSLLDWLITTEIPRLQKLLDSQRPIVHALSYPERFEGITLMTPATWLGAMLGEKPVTPVTTILNPADDLWQWTQHFLQCSLSLDAWEKLKQCNPNQQTWIQSQYSLLKGNLLRRSPNPYQCHLLQPEDLEIIENCLELPHLPDQWSNFAQIWHDTTIQPLCWATLNRQTGLFSLEVTPQNLGTILAPLWQKQPTLFIGGFLDTEKEAPTFCATIGLEPDLTSVNFTPPRQQEHTQVYLPEKRLSLPNTPEFQGELLPQLQSLIRLHSPLVRPMVLLINDVPLQAQIGAALAAEFGSRVKVEQSNLEADSILICGWEFWRTLTNPLFYGQTLDFPLPQLMAIATLPLPSLENPLVAGRVAQYKRDRQDWFRLYLLPTALRELQRAIFPLHQDQSLIAILDNRINHRAYGTQILEALQPCSFCNYLDDRYLEQL